jgi:Carboxypeptidase regulatory-like domain
MIMLARTLALTLGLILIPNAAFCATTGEIFGRVFDAHGNSAPGRLIGVWSPARVVSTRSDASGRFVFLDLIPGTYYVSPQYTDVYAVHEVATGTVAAGGTLRVDVSIIGGVNQSVLGIENSWPYELTSATNPLFDNAYSNAALLPFVPGVLVRGLSPR